MMSSIILNFFAGSICLLMGYVNVFYTGRPEWGYPQLMLSVINFFIVISSLVEWYYKKKLDSLSKDINSQP